MFTRPDSTFDLPPETVGYVLRDEAGPLHRIAKMIPSGSSVLDVGAGSGLLPRVLHAMNREVVIDGVEPNEHAAAIAAPHYRHLYQSRAEDLPQPLPNRYDFVVLADVIEHVADPLAFLRRLTDGLPRETRIVIDTPNVAFGAVRLALLKGRFDYVDSGILERTHLRFFTLSTLEQLIAELGMNVESLYLLQRDLLKTEMPLHHIQTDGRLMLRLLRDELASTYQFLFVLTREDVATERRTFGERLTPGEYLRWRLARVKTRLR
ncbi:MAG: class I SAM-dependent methyltransferase [Actinomycetota bacterium]